MIHIPFLPEGTRVRVRRSPLFPLDPETEGRIGLVLSRHQRGRGGKVAVQLDGDPGLRVFHWEELETVEAAVDLSQAGSARP
jgi:hypothetical protein